MYYEGDTVNRITIGRDMGRGVISSVAINGNTSCGGTLTAGGATTINNNKTINGNLYLKNSV